MNWDFYRYFLVTARSGSLKVAAKKLKVNQTTVGRNITALEEELGIRLFERRSDGFLITTAGQRILNSMQEVEDKINAAELVLAGKDEKPEGLVKLAMPGAFANQWLIPRLGPFIEKYSGVNLEFVTGPSLVNLTRREADLALRLVEPKQAELMVRRIGSMNLLIYGHKKLFEKSVYPRKIEDLERFSFIGLTPESTSKPELNLLKEIEGSIKVKVRSAAWSSVYAAIENGLGIGILPTFMGKNNSDLIPVLKHLTASIPLWMVYHPDLKHAARIRMTIDFILELLKNDFDKK